jgi:A/G-specific adenine glycosylase
VVFLETNIRHVLITTFFTFSYRSYDTSTENYCDAVAETKPPSDYTPSPIDYAVRAASIISDNKKQIGHETPVFKNALISGKSPGDKVLLEYADTCLYRENPRRWYNAMMDYGTWLKRAVPIEAPIRPGNKKQPAFKNSNRQIRGYILKYLLWAGETGKKQLSDALPFEPHRISLAVEQLISEGFLRENDGLIDIRT